MQTETNLTAAQIAKLTAKVTGEKTGRAASKEKAIARFARALEERIGEHRVARDLATILSASGIEVAEGALVATLDYADAEDEASTREELNAPKQDDDAPVNRKPEKAQKPLGKRAAILAAAEAGTLPEPPDFSAKTHARFRAKLAEIVTAADAKDLDALRAFEINPISSSPKAMAKYRDLCVIALEAQASVNS